MRRVLLLDTYSMFFRAYHALPAMCTTKGEPTSAMYGFCALLFKLLREHTPCGIVFAVDAPQKTFRHVAFTEYKAQREATPSDLTAQFGRLQELLRLLSVPVLCLPGYEADDILATCAQRIGRAGTHALVVSGDRDLMQLVDDATHVLFIGRRGKDAVLYTPRVFTDRFGFAPELLPSYVALVGDVSDNLPKVAGIGEKTASKLVSTYGKVDNLLQRVGEINPSKVQHALASHAEQIRQTEFLATLHRDLDVGAEPALFKTLPSTHAFAQVRELLHVLEFKSLISRWDALERGELRT